MQMCVNCLCKCGCTVYAVQIISIYTLIVLLVLLLFMHIYMSAAVLGTHYFSGYDSSDRMILSLPFPVYPMYPLIFFGKGQLTTTAYIH